jgi:hypothetical protein
MEFLLYTSMSFFDLPKEMTEVIQTKRRKKIIKSLIDVTKLKISTCLA